MLALLNNLKWLFIHLVYKIKTKLQGVKIGPRQNVRHNKVVHPPHGLYDTDSWPRLVYVLSIRYRCWDPLAILEANGNFERIQPFKTFQPCPCQYRFGTLLKSPLVLEIPKMKSLAEMGKELWAVKVADFGHLVLWRIKAYWQRTLVILLIINMRKNLVLSKHSMGSGYTNSAAGSYRAITQDKCTP